jgi:hypothetical protein
VVLNAAVIQAQNVQLFSNGTVDTTTAGYDALLALFPSINAAASPQPADLTPLTDTTVIVPGTAAPTYTDGNIIMPVDYTYGAVTYDPSTNSYPTPPAAFVPSVDDPAPTPTPIVVTPTPTPVTP